MAKRRPFCGQGVLEHRTVRETYTYKGHDLEVDQPGEFCNRCDEGIITGKDMKASEQAFHDLRANVDGLLTSGEVRRIRTKLKLSQRRAGEIFGGGPNAFSRYERGVGPCSPRRWMRCCACWTAIRNCSRRSRRHGRLKAFATGGLGEVARNLRVGWVGPGGGRWTAGQMGFSRVRASSFMPA